MAYDEFPPSLVFGTIQALTLAVIYLASQQRLTLGDIALLVMLIQQAGCCAGSVSSIAIRRRSPTVKIIEAMAVEPEPSDRGRKPLRISKGLVTFDDVVGYNEDTEVLSGIIIYDRAWTKSCARR